MAWLIRCLHILLKPSSREKGFVSLLVLGALAVGTLFYGAYANNVPQQIFGSFSRSMHNIGTGNPTNDDMDALHDALDASKKWVSPNKPWATPFDFNAWVEYFLYNEVTDLVEKNVNTATPDPGGRGRPGQPVACSLSVEPGLRAPGEYVTVTVTVPSIFKSRIAGISGSAGVEGFSIPPTGGSTVVKIPPGTCAQTVSISCEAYGQEGTVFSGSSSVMVDFSGLSDFDHDGIVDRCDPDDDNDGSLDGADCAPLDPNRFPGNEEICEDGIDQDCDGEDKPCETPGCNPPACCPEYPTICGDHCCPDGYTVFCGDYSCPTGTTCCRDNVCCPAGFLCCPNQANCCPVDYPVCCGDHCCPDGSICCGDGCCPAGTTCTGDGHCK